MKKFRYILFIIVLLLIVSLVGIQKTSAGIKPVTDWIFISDDKSYYVKTEKNNYEKLWNGKFRYTFKGYDKDSNQQEIIKVIDRKLRPDAYITIYAEGSYGQGWGEIEEKDVPKEVLAKMNN